MKKLKKRLGEKAFYAVRKFLPMFWNSCKDLQELGDRIIYHFPVKETRAEIIEKFDNLDKILCSAYNYEVIEAEHKKTDILSLVATKGYEFFEFTDLETARKAVYPYYKSSNYGGTALCILRDDSGLRHSYVTWLIHENALLQPKAHMLTEENMTDEWQSYLDKNNLSLPLKSSYRDDPFSISVLSVQINKDNGATYVVSRYNHDQSPNGVYFNPDACIGLNAICSGLREAYEDNYQAAGDDSLPDNVIEVIEGDKRRYILFNNEVNGIYFSVGCYVDARNKLVIPDARSERLVSGYVFNNRLNTSVNVVENMTFTFDKVHFKSATHIILTKDNMRTTIIHNSTDALIYDSIDLTKPADPCRKNFLKNVAKKGYRI